jgi:hypothetical protein
MRFTAELESHGGNKAGFGVPEEVVEALGGGRRPKVTVRVGETTYRSSIVFMGGRFLLGMSTENRSAAGVSPGNAYDVDVELDTAPRAVEVPGDLAEALAGDPVARAAWDRLSYSHQRAHVEPILAAKKPETRAGRITRTIEALRGATG